MKKMTCVLAILAAASTAALAKDLKQDKKTTPAISAAQMTDSEMDKVTAGFTWTNPGGHTINLNYHAQRACNHGHAPWC